MDKDLLKKLEKKITSIGTDDLYKRQIGNVELWFSPLSFTDQSYVQEALSSEESNSISNAKLMGLSRAVVGIDDLDLREYRDGRPVFVIVNKDRESVKVPMSKYFEHKMRAWGQDFIDLAFAVFVDISETSKIKFSKDVEFENQKDPKVELAEAELKVHQLRAQLGMSVLVEKIGSRYLDESGEPDMESLQDPEPSMEEALAPMDRIRDYRPEADETIHGSEQEDDEDDEDDEELPQETDDKSGSSVDGDDDYDDGISPDEAEILRSMEPPDELVPQPPVVTVPSAVPPSLSPIEAAIARRQASPTTIHGRESSPEKPLDITGSMYDDEVVEKMRPPIDPAAKVSVDPSPRSQSVNPRFKR